MQMFNSDTQNRPWGFKKLSFVLTVSTVVIVFALNLIKALP
jgi:hypothetical protein